MFCEFVCILSVILGIADSYTLKEDIMKNRRAVDDNKQSDDSFDMLLRKDWGARPALNITHQDLPVPYVVIHHTYIPGACYSKKNCSTAMREMQNFHMDTKGWWDIGYNWCIGSDGNHVFEGRGWDIVGAHSLHFNNVSIGICIIGDWRDVVPEPRVTTITKQIIKLGVSLGKISYDYKLIGHRQVRNTICPGDSLFNEIKTWQHYYEGTPENIIPE